MPSAPAAHRQTVRRTKGGAWDAEETRLVSIREKNWHSAVEWYRDKLGLKPVGLHDHPWCMMTLPEGDAVIALDGTNATSGGSNCVPGIQVDDLPRVIGLLKDRGVTFERDLEEDEGYRMAVVRDPEGNLLNLYEYLSTEGRAV